MSELQGLDAGALSIGFMVCVALAMYIGPKYKEWIEMRRVEAIDVIDDIIRSCAERGRRLHISPGGLSPTWDMSALMIPSSLAVMKHCAKLAAELNVYVVSSTMNPVGQLMNVDYVRQGYIEAGHPERFNIDDHVYFPGTAMATYNLHGFVTRHNVGGNIMVGMFGMGWAWSVAEVVRRLGGMTVGAEPWPETLAQEVPTCDYVILPEEHVQAGAYVSEDPILKANVLGADLAKVITVIIMFAAIVYFLVV